MRIRSEASAYLMLACVMLFWAGNSIVARAVRDEVPALVLAWLRWSGACLLLLPVAARPFWRERRAVLAGWRPILLLGLLGVVAFNGFLYSGLRTTTAANGLLLQALVPPLVLLIDRLLFGARARGADIVGVSVAAAGVAVIVFRGSPAALAAFHLGGGDALVLAGVVVWAFYTALLRTKPPLHPLTFLLATFAVGAIGTAPLAWLQWDGLAPLPWRPAVWGGIAYVAIFPSLVAYALFNQGVERLGPGRAGQAITLMPLFGAGLAALILGERLHPFHLAGMALILTGILLPVLARRSQ